MKILKVLGVLVAVVMLTISCATDPEERKKKSKEAFPNEEWRRPPAHWGGP